MRERRRVVSGGEPEGLLSGEKTIPARCNGGGRLLDGSGRGGDGGHGGGGAVRVRFSASEGLTGICRNTFN